VRVAVAPPGDRGHELIQSSIYVCKQVSTMLICY
jgi:hypothetical protein